MLCRERLPSAYDLGARSAANCRCRYPLQRNQTGSAGDQAEKETKDITRETNTGSSSRFSGINNKPL